MSLSHTTTAPVLVEARRTTFRVLDLATGLVRHFSNRAAAECYAARLEIARDCQE
jgi:hypothetical protein